MAGKIRVDPDDTPTVSRVDAVAHTGTADPGMATERGRSVIMVMSPTWSRCLSCRDQRASLTARCASGVWSCDPSAFHPQQGDTDHD